MNDARDQMAALFLDATSAEIGLPYTALDQLASLATNPETAPAVFAWLVEAGVLAKSRHACLCCLSRTTASCSSADNYGSPYPSHYHAAMDHEKASGVGT